MFINYNTSFRSDITQYNVVIFCSRHRRNPARKVRSFPKEILRTSSTTQVIHTILLKKELLRNSHFLAAILFNSIL